MVAVVDVGPRPSRRHCVKKGLVLTSLVALGLVGRPALARTFEPGSLIIPMDTTYQDTGMLKAYGLVYELLRNGVPVADDAEHDLEEIERHLTHLEGELAHLSQRS